MAKMMVRKLVGTVTGENRELTMNIMVKMIENGENGGEMMVKMMVNSW